MNMAGEEAGTVESADVGISATGPDPREVLAAWANQQDEWARAVVRLVLSTGRQLTEGDPTRPMISFVKRRASTRGHWTRNPSSPLSLSKMMLSYRLL